MHQNMNMNLLGQVLADRAETGSRHGRAAFSVLLFQDLAVVVLLMLIPLLAPQEGAAVGFATISKALGCSHPSLCPHVSLPAATLCVPLFASFCCIRVTIG